MAGVLHDHQGLYPGTYDHKFSSLTIELCRSPLATEEAHYPILLYSLSYPTIP